MKGLWLIVGLEDGIAGTRGAGGAALAVPGTPEIQGIVGLQNHVIVALTKW